MTSADRHRRERPSQAPVPHGLHPYDAIQHNASTVHRPTAQPTTYTETEMDDDRAELHDLGAIRVDAPRHPLGLDRMFERAALRGRPSGASAPVRPASPPQRAAPLALPLPLPLPPGTSTPGASPLAQLFLYPELTPLVLAHLDRPAHLAVAACVCSEWKYTAARRLYADVWVRPWESAPKAKLIALFRTLARNPDLCAFVRSLDIRFFPLDLRGDALASLEADIHTALPRMTRLTRLVWTRDRSISSDLFTLITALPSLRSLELSGHSTYDPSGLGRMSVLEDLRIMMPDASVRAALPSILAELAQRPRGGLQGLALVCKSGTLLSDDLLEHLAPHAAQLRRLTLLGGARLSTAGVYPLMEAARHLEKLTLDAPPYSDLIDLAHAPRAALHTFSLSFAAPRHGGGLISEDMPRLPSGADLRALELTLSRVSATHGGVPLPLDAFHALAAQTDFARITRLALLNLLLDAGMLATVLAASPALEELYISITGPEALDALAGDTPPDLRIVHANAPEQPHLVPPREVLAVAAANIPNCEQIGSMNRVYEVFRRYEGESVVVELHRWSRVDTPGYFRVWRP